MRKLTTFIYAVAITAAIFTIPMGIEAVTHQQTLTGESTGNSGTALMARKHHGHKSKKSKKKSRKSRHKKHARHKKAAARHGRKGHGHKIG